MSEEKNVAVAEAKDPKKDVVDDKDDEENEEQQVCAKFKMPLRLRQEMKEAAELKSRLANRDKDGGAGKQDKKACKELDAIRKGQQGKGKGKGKGGKGGAGAGTADDDGHEHPCVCDLPKDRKTLTTPEIFEKAYGKSALLERQKAKLAAECDRLEKIEESRRQSCDAIDDDGKKSKLQLSSSPGQIEAADGGGSGSESTDDESSEEGSSSSKSKDSDKKDKDLDSSTTATTGHCELDIRPINWRKAPIIDVKTNKTYRTRKDLGRLVCGKDVTPLKSAFEEYFDRMMKATEQAAEAKKKGDRHVKPRNVKPKCVSSLSTNAPPPSGGGKPASKKK